LKIGMTFDNFKISGKTPVSKERLTTFERGIDIS